MEYGTTTGRFLPSSRVATTAVDALALNAELQARRPRRLLTEGTPAAGVTRPIIGTSDNLTQVGDRQRWRPASAARPSWPRQIPASRLR
jgi:hypothetical protein